MNTFDDCLSFSHIRLGGSGYSPTTKNRLIWISSTQRRNFFMSVINEDYFEQVQRKVSEYHGVDIYGLIKQPEHDQMRNRTALLFSLEVVLDLHRAKYGTHFSPLNGRDALDHLLLQKYKWPLSDIRSLNLRDIVILLQEEMTPANLPESARLILQNYNVLNSKKTFPEIKDDEWDPDLHLSIPKQRNW